jgi:hypothetical protein
MASRALYIPFLLLATLPLGCTAKEAAEGRDPASAPPPPVMTVVQLEKVHGKALSRRPAEDQAEAEVLELAGGLSCQVQGGRVIACFRGPSGDETTLAYWRHLWRGVEQNYEELPSPDGRRRPDFQLTAPTLHAAVVYSPLQDKIVKVVTYGRSPASVPTSIR